MNIRKHLVDVLRLAQLFTPATRIALTGRIALDMTRFLKILALNTSIDPKTLRLGHVTVADIAQRISGDYRFALFQCGAP